MVVQRIPSLIIWILILGLLGGGVASAVYFKDAVKKRDDLVANLKRQDVSITVIEGKRREEIADQFAAAGITSRAAFLAASEGKEGRLFPDTYRFFPNTPATDVIAAMTANFTKRTAELSFDAKTLVLASIVERESINDADRATIAGVYANRIEIGMRLQADPTVEYGKATNDLAKDSNPGSDYPYWPLITRADYQAVNSPFNTYLIDGLPPMPICNPGKNSITAAINPAKHDYIFFGYKDGKLLLAKTLAQHEANLR